MNVEVSMYGQSARTSSHKHCCSHVASLVIGVQPVQKLIVFVEANVNSHGKQAYIGVNLG